ncbi:AlpA family phage regulatory protein [Ferrimonas sediminicola]|uniref:AlpA family phage regulatory protein n=1 Tax=Ferrimonas sediminicola TaxID=2569538 RepID=A0A4U1BC16_9GAMM|nr:AlpA family phage regulatory protein [Ferrimonas sediminicola]TKB47571.1 AlpA family phage regulatory protein [Ferrimonas sediminicola]
MYEQQTSFVDRLVREKERKEITSVSRTTAWQLEKLGLYPKRRKLHPTSDAVCWLLSELLEWVQAREIADGGHHE